MIHIFVCLVGAQVLSELDIVVPLQLLIGMFSDGVNSLKELANQRKARASDLTGNTGARRVRRTAMLKILLRIRQKTSIPVFSLLLPFISVAVDNNTDQNTSPHCAQIISWIAIIRALSVDVFFGLGVYTFLFFLVLFPTVHFGIDCMLPWQPSISKYSSLQGINWIWL